MERKKNPKADLESKKGIFVLIGLIISLSLSILAYESKSYDNLDAGFGDLTMDELFEDEIDITRPEPPPPPKEEPPPPPEVPEEIEIKENEEELENELEVDDAETDQDDMMEMPEEEFEEAFISVEKMPMLGDCKNEDCTQSEIMRFIARNFKYPEIAKANGVEGRVILEFVVEKNGKIGRVKILKGLDKHVDKAAIEVVEKLNDKKSPKFSPGRQIGKAVPVKYTVPIKCTLG
ncbi:MAG: energy transducer TonB [Flavobacteriales bacterium]|jgi:protein TonB|nr:energy transducer TonB [Flavobacteriales bacterium]MBT4738115.1 energy transducer TonB [Flavobacteriales bacterium]MBT6699967.1 energy transducer TonB [Flavobacteriales bacterium]MBT6814981.1 energy transducer TonB [Flavobacteriales bacterium]MBT7726153.1 energy transducer TonB [Flavobacteriales bacterium]